MPAAPIVMALRYLSVCSGIESASVAWEPLGWKPLAFSEIDAAPRAVLRHRFPDVPLHGDFTLLRDEPWIVDADILVGGTPCQAFSIAGLRKSLDDDRGNLTLEFVRLADAIDAARHAAGKPGAVVVWENVPGVLNVGDNAFGCFLGALVGADAPLVPGRGQRWTDAGLAAGPRRAAAWCIKDAQYFELAQRRERVFVVACPRDGADPSEILFEPAGLRRHSPPRREKGEAAAAATVRSTDGGSDVDHAGGGHLVATAGDDQVLAFGGNDTRGALDVATACNAHGGPHGRLDFESETFIVGAEPLPILESGKRTGRSATDTKAGDGIGHAGDPMFTLGADSRHAVAGPVYAFEPRERGDDGRGYDRAPAVTENVSPTINTVKTPVTAYRTSPNCGVWETGDRVDALTTGTDRTSTVLAFDTTQVTHPENRSQPSPEKACHALSGKGHAPAIAFQTRGSNIDTGQDVTGTIGSNADRASGSAPCIAFGIRSDAAREGVAKTLSPDADGRVRLRDPGFNVYEEIAPTLSAGAAHSVATSWAVRRLTPTECERLQGFPDGWTLVPNAKGQPMADGPRYRMIGNSMATRVMRWLGQRIDGALRNLLEEGQSLHYIPTRQPDEREPKS